MYQKISIVTIVFNDKNGLEETAKSVISQVYPNLEYIIIDGGSTDGTVEIIKKYGDYISYWISEPDKGIYDAMNKGLRKATGEWVCFMNAKDVFADSDVLERLRDAFNSDADVIVGNTLMIDNDELREYKARKNRNISSRNVTSMGFVHQSSFVRTELARMYPFDTRYRLAADFGMFYELHRNHCKFLYVDFPISCFDTTGVSMNNVYQGKLETLTIARPDCPLRNRIRAHLITTLLRIRAFVDRHIVKVI